MRKRGSGEVRDPKTRERFRFRTVEIRIKEQNDEIARRLHRRQGRGQKNASPRIGAPKKKLLRPKARGRVYLRLRNGDRKDPRIARIARADDSCGGRSRKKSFVWSGARTHSRTPSARAAHKGAGAAADLAGFGGSGGARGRRRRGDKGNGAHLFFSSSLWVVLQQRKTYEWVVYA